MNKEDLNRIRQWFNAVQDLNSAFLDVGDYQLVSRVHKELGIRMPDSIHKEADRKYHIKLLEEIHLKPLKDLGDSSVSRKEFIDNQKSVTEMTRGTLDAVVDQHHKDLNKTLEQMYLRPIKEPTVYSGFNSVYVSEDTLSAAEKYCNQTVAEVSAAIGGFDKEGES